MKKQFRQIDVNTVFSEDDNEYIGYESEDGTMMWPENATIVTDWKDPIPNLDQLAARGEVVVLFESIDTMIYASMGDAIIK